MRISDWSSDVCSSDLAGDLIVEANGKPILDFGQLRNMVGLMRVDDKVDLKLYRGGKPKNISVKIGKDDKIAAASALTKDVSPRLAGATFAPLDEQTANAADVDSRSEEHRVGKECVRTCRYRWSKNNKTKNN